MQPSDLDSFEPTVQIPVMTVAEVQDSLLIVLNDLHRLDGLINHAATILLDRFSAASESIAAAGVDGSQPVNVSAVRDALHAAVTELQFQDMASQLIVHTTKVIKGCADRLAADTMEPDEDEAQSIIQAIPSRPNPVTQDEMDAGSIELF